MSLDKPREYLALLKIKLCENMLLMNFTTNRFLVVILGLATLACQKKVDENFVADDPEYIHQSMQKLTDVIVYDIFSPPVASRIYV